jgi:hypothetical protein
MITASDLGVLGLPGEFQETCPEVEVLMSDVGGVTAVSHLLAGEQGIVRSGGAD